MRRLATDPPRSVHLLLLCLLASTLPAAPAETTAPAETVESSVLARWRGGELDRATFLAEYEGAEAALAAGGRELEEALCKAVYHAIYRPRALTLGLERAPELLAEMREWDRRTLAAAYLERHRPDFEAAASPEALRTYYETHLDELFPGRGSADLEILYLRCPEGGGSTACRERLAAARARLAAGESFLALAEEERARSGAANGAFSDLTLAQLASDLRRAVERAEPGTFTPVVESPIGLFWIRVLAKKGWETKPLAEVESVVRTAFLRDRAERWQEAEIAGLRRQPGVPPEADEEEVLAAAAKREGLDEDPEFQTRRERTLGWKLADHAFYRDSRVLPDDRELARQLAADPGKRQRYRLYSLVLAVLPTGEDRYRALRRMETLRERLEAAGEPAALLRSLRGEEGVALFELEEKSERQLRRLHPPLARAVSEAVAEGAASAGDWRGSLTLGEGASEELPLPLGISLLAFSSVRDPEVSEIRRELLEAHRGKIGSGVEAFLELLGEPWELELLPVGEPPAGATAGAGPQ